MYGFLAINLSLNIEKTINYIVFSSKYNNANKYHFNIIMNNKRLLRVNYTKFLGVTIDSGLTWNNHIRSISVKMSRGSGPCFLS